MTDDPLQHTATATAEIAVEPFGDESIGGDLIVQAINALDGPDVEVHPGLLSTLSSGTRRAYGPRLPPSWAAASLGQPPGRHRTLPGVDDEDACIVMLHVDDPQHDAGRRRWS